MKDSYANQHADPQRSGGQTEGDWVVIRRRKAPKPADRIDASSIRALDRRAAEVARALNAARARPVNAVDDVKRAAPPVDTDVPDATDPKPLVLNETEAPELSTVEPIQGVKPAAKPIARCDPVNTGMSDQWTSLQRVPMGAQQDGKRARPSAPSLIDYFRADPIAKGFDLLRTRLVRTIRAYGWKRIAVVAPTRSCGTTFTAVNLALSLSRVPGSRTVLMDLNQRTPGVADALGLRSTAAVEQFLNANVGALDFLVRPSQTLAVGTTDLTCNHAAEVLHDPLTGEVLDDMIEMLDPDLVIYDLPPILEFDDLAAFLPQVDGVLLVADGTQTVPSHISNCESLIDGQSQLLGVVLNRGRSDG